MSYTPRDQFYQHLNTIRRNDAKSPSIGALNLGDRNSGIMEDMSFLQPHEITHPIMYGVDVFRRRVLVLSIRGDVVNTFADNVNNDPVHYVQILYQRYTNNDYNWVSRNGVPLLHTEQTLKEEDFQLLNDLLSMKSVDVANCKIMWETNMDNVKCLRIMTVDEVKECLN